MDQHTELVLSRMIWNRFQNRLADFFVVHFNVADSCFHSATPIHQSVTSVDESFLEELAECFIHCSAELLVHSEVETIPI